MLDYSFKPMSQSNHDSYFIPPELMALKGKPLYILIAYWGLLRQKSFFREDVARAFGITERRAADLMRYLYKKQTLVASRLENVVTNTSSRRGKKMSMVIFHIHLDLNEDVSYPRHSRIKKTVKSSSKRSGVVGGMVLWDQLLAQR